MPWVTAVEPAEATNGRVTFMVDVRDDDYAKRALPRAVVDADKSSSAASRCAFVSRTSSWNRWAMQQPNAKQTALLPGFGVLFHKEFLEARRSKRIIIFLVIMTGALILVPVIGYLRIENFGTGSRHVVEGEDMQALVGSGLRSSDISAR